MMHLLREVLSVAVFAIAIILLVDLTINGFNLANLGAAVGCFVAAYILWPSKRRGQRKEESNLLDILEFIIELPVDLLLWVFRSIGRLFRSNNGDLDIDL